MADDNDPGLGESMGAEDVDFNADYDTQPEQMIRDIGDHPLMEPVQEALYRQLAQNHERITLELREKEEDLRRVKQRRENIGVELYGVQQQLAKLQMALENTHTNFNILSDLRVKEEEKLQQYREQYKNSKSELQDEQKQMFKNQSELDALSATLRQVELYNVEMKSEISVTRRATYKAEENVKILEFEKKRQDLYIDQLNEQLKSLHEQLALYEAQLVSQKQETQAAVETLTDAGREMEAINFEKKQLLQQWKSSLIGMQRRDEALQSTNEALQKQVEATQAVEAEIEGYKTSISKAQQTNETLTARKDRVEAEAKFTEEQLESVRAERDKLAERYAMLQRSMTQTDTEEEKVDLQSSNLATAIRTVEQNLQIVTRERQKLEAGIAANKNTQAMVSKATKNLYKTSEQVTLRIHEKEIERASMQNELARIRVDALNTDAHNAQLKDTLSKLVAELKEKDGLIEKYELEIRQRNDEIEKKMYRVDRLNRRYEQLTSGIVDENTGPLEATIINLSKEIVTAKEVNQGMQREWLQNQTQLVNMNVETENQSEANQELRSRESILGQKHVRLTKDITSHTAEVAVLRHAVETMHTDMVRLNTLIAKHGRSRDGLADANYALEIEFVQELKELEGESLQSEANVEEIKSAKQQVLDEIVEAERQIMLWEKKIQLEKETQAALDPEVGQAEARSMEKEIHRMRLRLDTLKRDQERMIKEMERAVYKREAIATRHRGKRTKEVTQASLKKKLATMTRTLKTTTSNAAQHEIAIKKKLDEMEQVGVELEKSTSKYGTLEEDASNLQNTINNCLYEKQRNLDLLSKQQRMVQRFQDLEEGGARARALIPDSDPVQVEMDLREAESSLGTVRTVIGNLRGQYEHLDEVLSRVLHLADS